MKRLLAFLFAAALTLPLASCRRPAVPEATPAPTEAPAEFIGYTAAGRVRFWPDGADEDTAVHALFVDYPVFDATHPAASSINAAIDDYILQLADKIGGTITVPAEDPGWSKVTFEVRFARGCLNVVFHEYLNGPKCTSALIFTERGDEVSLGDIFCTAFADRMAAEAIAARTGADAVSVLGWIDRGRSAEATEDGCRLYFASSTVEQEETSFDLTFDDVLGGLVAGEDGFGSFEAYEKAQKLMTMAVCSLLRTGENVENGAVSPYAAGIFMTQAAAAAGVPPRAGRRIMAPDEFTALWSACFGAEYPGVDPDSDSVRIEDGAYSVSVTQPGYLYSIEPVSVSAEGDTLALKGELMTGAFGDPYSEFVCPISVTLVKNAESPYLWTIRDMIFNN